MNAIIVDSLCSVGGALARSLATDSSLTFQAVTSIEQAIDLSQSCTVDSVVLTRSVCRDCSQLGEIVRRFPKARLVLLDDSLDWNRAQAAIDSGMFGYLCKTLTLPDLVAAFHCLAKGDRVFMPEVAERLVFSVTGVTLPPNEVSPKLSVLTQRELQVMKLITRGLSVRECAAKLGISQSTVDNHKSRLMAKLHVHKSTELVHIAIRERLNGDDDTA